MPGFCTATGAFIQGLVTTVSGKVFAVAGQGAESNLMQYYPALASVTTAVKKIGVSQGVLNHVVLAGLNADDRYILTLYDTSNDTELQLLGPDNEIEIYHLNYVATTNRIMFDGLRFSDNKYVIGQYDLNTMTFSASQTGSTKLTDFQTF